MHSQPGISPSVRRRSAAYVFVPRIVFAAVIALLLAGGGWMVVAKTMRHDQAPAAKPVESSLTTFKCAPGPWGDIECSEIPLEIPVDAVSDNYLTRQRIVWSFPGYTRSMLVNLFTEAGVSENDIAELLNTMRADANGLECLLYPSDKFVLGLSSSARGTIYGVLASDPRNIRQAEPFRFPAEHLDAWFDKTAVSEATIAAVKRLLYRRGDLMVFADQDVLLDTLPDRAAKVQAIRMLARTSGLVLKLHIKPGQDVEPLVRYWGVNSRQNELRPLMQALANSPQGGDIGAAQLLPPFARKRVYTYPMETDWGQHTCYWSAMNFFNDKPDDGFEQLPYTAHEIDHNYAKIARDSARYGDLVLLMKGPNEAVHACVYLADNIVFTKNGPGRSSPWILMRLDDVVDVYSILGEPTIQVYRRNGE